jgi:hypothetical protein
MVKYVAVFRCVPGTSRFCPRTQKLWEQLSDDVIHYAKQRLEPTQRGAQLGQGLCRVLYVPKPPSPFHRRERMPSIPDFVATIQWEAV